MRVEDNFRESPPNRKENPTTNYYRDYDYPELAVLRDGLANSQGQILK